jgi:two-component system, NtrC family, sensor histidine kinase HydH
VITHCRSGIGILPEEPRAMNDRQQRRWSWWVARGAVTMAVLASVSLAVTVALASHALDDAADVVVLGDGDTLSSQVVVDLWEAESLTSETLARVLAKHSAQGLQYVALNDREDLHVIVEAGTREIRSAARQGEVVRQGRRVRLFGLIPPRAETRAANVPGFINEGPPGLRAYPRPFLAIEFEPPVIERLQKDLRVISVVAGIAVTLLVALAAAWSRTRGRFLAVQEKAERERSLVALGRASSVIAHELRNPLAGLKGHAQLLLEDVTGPSHAKAARVVEGAERLERLTTVLLDFVRDGPLDVRTITPAELADRALVGLPKERVHVDLSHAPETLHVDTERASLAVRNLLENAVQATPAEAEQVEVRISTERNSVVIEVRDHGPGLAGATEAQLFEPFVTTKARGTGLGLSIARRVAEQHHGSLMAETHRQGGAVFRLAFPLSAKPAGHP